MAGFLTRAPLPRGRMGCGWKSTAFLAGRGLPAAPSGAAETVCTAAELPLITLLFRGSTGIAGACTAEGCACAAGCATPCGCFLGDCLTGAGGTAPSAAAGALRLRVDCLTVAGATGGSTTPGAACLEDLLLPAGGVAGSDAAV